MSQLTRYTQKVFASTAGSNQLSEYGSFIASPPGNLYSGSTITPAIVQQLSNFLDGQYAAVGGSYSPTIQDHNSLFYLLSYQSAYVLQSGIPEWDSGTTYYIGNMVRDNSGIVYVSLTDSNLNNNITDASKWRNILNYLANVAANDSNINFTATSNRFQNCLPTAPRTYKLPATNILAGDTWTFYNRGISNFPTTFNYIELVANDNSLIGYCLPNGSTIIQSNTSNPTTSTDWNVINSSSTGIYQISIQSQSGVFSGATITNYSGTQLFYTQNFNTIITTGILVSTGGTSGTSGNLGLYIPNPGNSVGFGSGVSGSLNTVFGQGNGAFTGGTVIENTGPGGADLLFSISFQTASTSSGIAFTVNYNIY